MSRKTILFLSFFLFSAPLFAQENAVLTGKLTDEDGQPIPRVNIYLQRDSLKGTLSGKSGQYKISVPAKEEITIVFRFLGYKLVKKSLTFAPGEQKSLNIQMEPDQVILKGAEIIEERNRPKPIQKLHPLEADIIPTPTRSIENIVISEGLGVRSQSELSTQYSVRGGNFDENLVYVNDIPIYRPFLVRSGQQEGLSFVNPDMVEDVLFSAGGFEARYGDKMSSVLDIKYRKPTEFRGTVGLSLLGGSLHVEDTLGSKSTYMLGLRQKSNQYLLNSFETQGDYKPSFTDIQSMLTYDISKSVEVNLLGNISRNKYVFVPQNRRTKFGTLNQALSLRVFFEGQEIDDFQTYSGAGSVIVRPLKEKEKMELKFIGSAFRSIENETFDILGEYWLDELETDFGEEDFGETAFNIGVGGFLNHARNELDALVYNARHVGTLYSKHNILVWGGQIQREEISDKLSEWQMIDSAGFTVPHPQDIIGYESPDQRPEQVVRLQNIHKARINVQSNRYSSFLQNTWKFSDSSKVQLTAGARLSYWNLNDEWLFSPRASISYNPQWKRDIIFKASSGVYYQPPFYRELRDLNGNLNLNIKSQRSIHFVVGGDYNFQWWRRPFKFVAEAYYKDLNNLIPYEIDNVRIRYYATNNAKGYATGLDMKVNGEFVKGVQSWARLSILQTRENLNNDFFYHYFDSTGTRVNPDFTAPELLADSQRIEPGFIPRPTDQRVHFSMYFQDYLPRFPTFKMHLNLVFGTSLPFGPPSFERYKDTLRTPMYRRVDIGFSKQIMDEYSEVGAKSPLRFLKSLWVSMEVFNLLQVNNTISYLWIKDVSGRSYAIPNFLTSRRLNLRLIAKF